jgi:dTDP-4-amino-4,6-dideoxygalactose transaminase
VSKGDHEIEGINSRLDGLQAAILSAKLPHLEGWTGARQAVARVYDRELAGVGDIVTPAVAADRDHVYHLYVIRTTRRDELRAFLKAHDIETGIHYPTALPFLKAYAYLKHGPSDFPEAFRAQSEILSLPLYAELTPEMQRRVIETIRDFYRHVPAESTPATAAAR